MSELTLPYNAIISVSMVIDFNTLVHKESLRVFIRESSVYTHTVIRPTTHILPHLKKEIQVKPLLESLEQLVLWTEASHLSAHEIHFLRKKRQQM